MKTTSILQAIFVCIALSFAEFVAAQPEAVPDPEDIEMDPDVIPEEQPADDNQDRGGEDDVGNAPGPDIAASFVTMDRGSAGSRVGGALSISLLGDEAGDTTGIRLDAFGQHELTSAPISIYWAVPLSIASVSDSTETGLGNMEGGALYVMPAFGHSIVLRGGITLPTADAGPGFGANVSGVFSRLTDFASISPETLWLRASGSAMRQLGRLFYRVDVGLDLPLSSADGFDAKTLLRINGAAGFQLSSLTITGELVTTGRLASDGDLVSERFLHTLAGMVHFPIRKISCYAGFVTPLDSDFIGEVFVVTAGATFNL